MRILVTGTSGGIGGAVVAAARAAGHDVVAFDRADFADIPRSLAAKAGYAAATFDAVVFATGECAVRPLLTETESRFVETLRVNCTLFLMLMRELVAARLYSPTGMKAVAISSVSAREGWAGGAAYCASKGALSALCRALDVELAPRHITVSALEPRYVKTRMFDLNAGRMGVPAAAAQSPAEFAHEVLKGIGA